MADLKGGHIYVCGCGTCQEAYDTAWKVYSQAIEHNCPNWYLAVTIAHNQILELLLQSFPRLEECGAEVQFAYDHNADESVRRFNEVLNKDIERKGYLRNAEKPSRS